MATAERPRRRSIDLQEQASLIEQLAGGALVLSALGLAAFGIARGTGSHPSGTLVVAALALAGAGVIVLALSFGLSMAGGDRRAVWSATVDGTTRGLLLLVLQAVEARPDPGTAVASLAPVRCRIGAGAAAGDLVGSAGAGAGGPWEASDDRISRIGATLMTRFHPAFFAGAPEPWSGTYEFTWEERLPDGEWRPLAGGAAEVEFLPLPEEPAPADAVEQAG